ncbi:hypothetical protein ONZ45_g12546 [Pleurotus djamor]|nr:hypothetical protein ONZ45_g12546 [Pleurotus djamor]
MLLRILLKNIILVTTAAAYHLGVTPPNPLVEEKDRQAKGFFEGRAIHMLNVKKAIIWSFILLEIYSSLHNAPANSLRTLPSSTPAFLIGASLAVAGSLLRLWCYKTLGKLFDFQFRIHPDHKLITSGPYSYVRHPSYLGAFAMRLGVAMVVFAPGSWMMEFGQLHILSILAGGFWCVDEAFVIIMLWKRMRAEDEGLRKKFGNEWDQFAQTVPYRLVPGLY